MQRFWLFLAVVCTVELQNIFSWEYGQVLTFHLESCMWASREFVRYQYHASEMLGQGQTCDTCYGHFVLSAIVIFSFEFVSLNPCKVIWWYSIQGPQFQINKSITTPNSYQWINVQGKAAVLSQHNHIGDSRESMLKLCIYSYRDRFPVYPQFLSLYTPASSSAWSQTHSPIGNLCTLTE